MSNPTYQGHRGSPTQVAAAFASVLVLFASFADTKNPIKLGFAVLAQFPLLVLIENERKKIERGCTR